MRAKDESDVSLFAYLEHLGLELDRLQDAMLRRYWANQKRDYRNGKKKKAT
jgi:hypothetical protein